MSTVERPNYARVPMPVVSNTNIEAWFTSMDFWFTASGIFDDTQRHATVLAAIDPNVLTQLMDALCETPQVGKYEFAKTKLIAHFADSEQRKLNRLLSEMPLGDKRPSELYHEMKRVAGTVLGEAALKGLWAQRLPEAARPVIAASSGSAAEFTKIADSIVDALAPRSIRQATTEPLNEMAELRAVIAELRNQINNFPRRSRSRSRGNGISGNGPRFHTPANSGGNQQYGTNNRTPTPNANPDPELCWYHQKYGNGARNCRDSCRYFNRGRAAVSAVDTDPNQTA